MSTCSRRELLASFLTLPALSLPALSLAEAEWSPLFDGRTLNGWSPSSNTGSFRVAEGVIAADGPQCHLFYTGPVGGGDFRNFVFRAEVMAKHACNSGIYFHTRHQTSGWPDLGFEVQVNNTATGEGSYNERKKTASLYGVRDVYRQFIADDEWFRLEIAVRGKTVQIRLNDMLMVDYVEPATPVRAGVKTGRVLDHGTFALQCHDPGSKAFFRNLMVAPLPDDVATEGAHPVVDEAYREILALHAHNFPVVDYHVHLKGGLTLEELLRKSRRDGICYGVAVNCGVGFPVTTDAGAEEFFASLKGQPVFKAMQAEGREWLKMFSKKTFAKFDYIFTDSMTFTDDDGRRMRTWIADEVGPISNKQRFMETLVNRTVGVLNNEPIDIYANPTYIPDVIVKDYDELWTPDRMDRVIEAAKKNDIAIELNNRYNIPSAAFVKRAKAAGVKFSIGTNNIDGNLGRIDYSRKMIRECGLGWQDMFVPKGVGEKAADRRG